MKNFIIAVMVLAAGLTGFTACSGCSSDKSKTMTDTVATFAKADTAEVLALSAKYLEYVKEQKYDEAVSMLNCIENDSVMQLTEEKEREVRIQQKTFPVLSYRVAGMDFVNENRVKVTYAVEFFKKNPKDSIQNTIRIAFAPQRINGQWYLELLDRPF